MDNILIIVLDKNGDDYTNYRVGQGDIIFYYEEPYDWAQLPLEYIDLARGKVDIYRSNEKFANSEFNCAMQESSSAKEFYEILLGSFLNVNSDDYPFEELLKNGANKFFTKYE